ncbi:MAG TPA: alpha/beta fold hydrolase [Myxococcales bacterium]|nr:alpha/beta fold hydrolase [Myxococcales bacterium]
MALSLLRRLAERGARVGWVHGLRFAVRGPEGGPELLILHGLGDSIAGWARVLGPLSRTHRVHIIDLPGHGLSDPPADYRFATLLAPVKRYAAGLRAPVLVGHSLGGWLAARLALTPGSHTRGLILVNPGGAVLSRAEWAEFRQVLASGDTRAYLERAFYSAPLALRLFPDQVARAISSPAALSFLAGITREDLLRDVELAALQLPVRIVWGEHDRLLPAATLPFFRAHLPAAEIVLLPRAGHLPHLEAPRALARAIAAPFESAKPDARR